MLLPPETMTPPPESVSTAFWVEVAPTLIPLPLMFSALKLRDALMSSVVMNPVPILSVSTPAAALATSALLMFV